jgi:hypothetical protein
MLLTNDITITDTAPGVTVGEFAGERLCGTISKGALVASFDGVNTLLEYVGRKMPTAKGGGRSNAGAEKGFFEFGSFTEAMKVYKTNPSSIRKFNENDTRLEGGDASGIDINYDVTGDMLDMGRFMDDEPECFGSLTNGTPRAKRVHIVTTVGFNGSVYADTILARSKRLVRLVDWLEGQQIRVQVTGLHFNSCMMSQVNLKQYHEPLDLNDIAIMAHPDFPRRVGFRMIEHSKAYSSSYGNSSDFVRYMSTHPDTITSSDPNELVVFAGNNPTVMNNQGITTQFDQLETKIAEVMADDTSEPQTLAVLV